MSYIYGAPILDLETSRIGAPYIYDISHLRVNICSSNIVRMIKLRILRYIRHVGRVEGNEKYTDIHSFISLSYDRSKASSKASSPHSAIQSFLFQMGVSSPFLKVIQ